MKRVNYLILAMLICISVNAQTTKIKGKVADAKTKEVIAFANIMQMSDASEDAKLLNGTVANENGEFVLQVKEQKPTIKINSLGYKDSIFTLSVGDYKKSNGEINIGEILLFVDAENLQEVSIIGKQTRIEMDNDKIVMNVDEGVSATSANVFEMLRKVPGVVIDKDENITLQGQSGILFQFDGRDIRIPYDAMKSILKGMSPNDIAKIETITNPSSKYEAEGTAGIINIITAGQKTTGFSGNAHTWLGINEDIKNNTGVNFNWVTNRWTITTGASVSKFTSRNSMEMDQYIWNNSGDTTRIHMDETDDKHTFNGMDFNLSADYKIDDNSSVGAMVSFNRHWAPFNDSPEKLMLISKNPYSVVDSSYTTDDDNKFFGNNLMGSIYYSHKLDSLGGQYSAAVDFNHNTSGNVSKSLNNYYNGNKGTLRKTESLYNDADNKYDSYSAKFDVVKPFNAKHTLEFGVKTRLALVENDFEAKINDVFDNSRSQTFSYKENVNAAYVSFSDKMNNRFSFRAGLRFEHTYTSFDSKTMNAKHDNNYFSLFPSLTASLRVGQTDNLSLSYTYRIFRPDYNSLNPFVTKASDYSVSTGNPYLNPEYTHKLSLNYAFHYLVFLTASYGYTNNEINQTITADRSTLLLTQKPYNNGYSQDFNIGLSSMLPLGPVEWTLWLQTAYAQAKCDDEHLKSDISRWSFMTWQSLAVDFFWKSKLSVSCFYSTGGVQMGGEYDGMLMLSANISKDFLNKALKVSVGVDNLPKRHFHIDTYNQNYRFDMNMCWQRPQFTANITYNFGKAASNNTLKRIQSDDMDSRSSGESSAGQQQGQTMGR